MFLFSFPNVTHFYPTLATIYKSVMSDIVDTPASTSTSATTENETVSLAEEIKKYDIEALISFLQGQDLKLSETAIKILETQEVNGRDFFDLTQEELERWGMPGGPAKRLVKFAKECKDKKLRSFSSYKTKKELSEVLRKYGIDTNDIRKIPPFVPEPVKIDDEDEELEQCITEIKRTMHLIGSTTSSNEAVRCEYISVILYASIFIARRITEKRITIDPQLEVVGEEATGRVDYAIKKIIDVVNEELIAITEGKQKDLVAGFVQNVMQLESSHHTNTRKRKASVAFDDEFDYLYGIVTTGMIFFSWHCADFHRMIKRY